MVSIAGMFQHYRQAFDDHQAKVLAEATVQIEADLVRREDFSALTATVGRLADAQAQLRTTPQESAPSDGKCQAGCLVQGHWLAVGPWQVGAVRL